MNSFIEKSHPEHDAEEADQLDGLNAQLTQTAAEIEAHRLAAQPPKSQNQWVREWPRLGSQKTYSLIVAGDLETIGVAGRLPQYRAVLAAIRANGGDAGKEPLYEDLAGAQAVHLAVLRLMKHSGKDRLILVEGGSGSGKTSALDVLEAAGAGGSRVIRFNANETWKSQREVMREFLAKLGKSDIPAVTGEMFRLLVETIKQQGRIIIAVDEAHHVSGQVLNLFKALLNDTELRLILAGMKTLFGKLRASASEEAKQLYHNRLFQRVSLAGPDSEGVRVFLARRLGSEGGWKAGTLNQIAQTAQHCGHWSFLRRIHDQLRNDGIAAPNDSDLMAAAQSAALEIA